MIINHQNYNGKNYHINYCTFKNNINIFKWLTENKANVHRKNKNGDMILSFL